MYTRSGVCHIGISDRSLIYAIRKLCIPKEQPKIVKSQRFRNFNTDSFRANLNLASWHLVNLENPNSAWEIWARLFLEIRDFHAPKRKREIRNKLCFLVNPGVEEVNV